MPTDMEKLKGSWVGSNTQNTESNAVVSAITSIPIRVVLDDAATAGTAVADHTVWTVIDRCKLPTGSPAGSPLATRFPKLTTGVAVTASGTDNFTVFIGRSRAGAATVDVASFQSNVAGGNTVLRVARDLNIIGDAQFEVGDVIMVRVVKTGSGVAITSATVKATLSFLLELN